MVGDNVRAKEDETMVEHGDKLKDEVDPIGFVVRT